MAARLTMMARRIMLKGVSTLRSRLSRLFSCITVALRAAWLRIAAIMLLVVGSQTVSFAQETDGQPPAAPDSLHIGVLAPLSGPFERLGRQVEQGVALALMDAAGRGVSVTVTAVDDGCDEEVGRDAANQLVGAQVDVVIGGVCWRPAVAARDVLMAQSIPFLASGVRYDGFTDETDGPVLRIAGRDDEQASCLADAIVSGRLDPLLGGVAREMTLALLYTNGNYGRFLADAVQAALDAAGVTLSFFEAFSPEAGLGDPASRVNAERADLVMVFAGQADSALMIDALRARMPNVVVLAADSVMTAEFALLADAAAEGTIFARPTPWRSLVDEAVLAGLEGETPGAMAGLILPSMAATQVALARAQGEGEPFDTVLGPLRFDPNGDADVPSFDLWQWRGGFIRPFDRSEIEALSQ